MSEHEGQFIGNSELSKARESLSYNTLLMRVFNRATVAGDDETLAMIKGMKVVADENENLEENKFGVSNFRKRFSQYLTEEAQ